MFTSGITGILVVHINNRVLMQLHNQDGDQDFMNNGLQALQLCITQLLTSS